MTSMTLMFHKSSTFKARNGAMNDASRSAAGSGSERGIVFYFTHKCNSSCSVVK